ncbi:unnamed protein product [Sphenostylis stenocarpa]|uniref:t-SNARE coiled-coil homology domain-containing protein n=1 Tax=Sphenostylis stenocarpa TaxID=92480 RepID=A0AA86TIF8_9FABA|nr:unnamed protein product [Sphenostylis stenocarpa]
MAAKLDVGVDFTKICTSHMHRLSRGLVSMATGSLRLKHPGLIYYSDLLDMSWHRGLDDSDLLVTYRYLRPRDIGPPCLTVKHSVSPEVGIHGIPTNNLCHSQSDGVRLSKLSIGFDYIQPSESDSSQGKATGVYFKRFHFSHDGGRSISTDRDGFQLTRSGGPADNMVVVSQESRFEDQNDHGFTNFSVQMELGTPIPPTLFAYYRFEVSAARGIKLGPALFFSRMSGGTVMGSFAPYQAFAIGGPSSVRGYGEGAISVGQSCLVSTSELSIPLNKKLTGVIFLDCGSDLWSSDKTIQERDMVSQDLGLALEEAFDSKPLSLKYKDGRNSRVALFDGIEEGGIRASSLYSTSHEIDEHGNEQALDGLQDRVKLLKRLSGDINEEVDSHNRMLDRMGNDMDSSRGVLSGTMDKFKVVFETKSSRRMFSLVASFLVLFLIIYYLSR